MTWPLCLSILAHGRSNILAEAETPHFEQAMWAEDLSAQSLSQVKALTRTQWQQLLQLMTPELERLIAEDQSAGRPADHRLRIGLYSYSEPVPATPTAAPHDKP